MNTTTMHQPEQGLSRAARVGGSIAVAVVLIFSAWLVAGREGLNGMGRGGVDAQVLPIAGQVAPNFTALDPLGQIHTLSDYRGQPVWINFWGSWCPPCRAEMPDMQAAYAQVQSQGVILLAVSLDESAIDAQSFAARNGATFTVLSDPTRKFTGAVYPIFNFPTHIFINRDGTINRLVLSPMSTEQAVQYAEEIISS
jgi:peroxiredoxin